MPSSIDDNKFELKIAPDSLKRITDKLRQGFDMLQIPYSDLSEIALNFISRYNSVLLIDSFSGLAPKTPSPDT